MSLITTILQTSDSIVNSRTQYSVLASVGSEVGELCDEVNIANGQSYKTVGSDGVIGESIDAIISLVDLIYIYAKDNGIELTEDYLIEVAKTKLAKWKSLA